jgi:hypothetical protein
MLTLYGKSGNLELIRITPQRLNKEALPENIAELVTEMKPVINTNMY